MPDASLAVSVNPYEAGARSTQQESDWKAGLAVPESVCLKGSFSGPENLRENLCFADVEGKDYLARTWHWLDEKQRWRCLKGPEEHIHLWAQSDWHGDRKG